MSFAWKHSGAIFLAVLIALSGCAYAPPPSNSSEQTAEITISPTTEQTPEKGTTLLAVSKIEASATDRFDDENTITFDTLTKTQQQEFEQAVNCSCSVETHGFSFGANQQVYAVVYEGDYYKVLVMKV
jgi:ABC-type transport system substrate-binding protein